MRRRGYWTKKIRALKNQRSCLERRRMQKTKGLEQKIRGQRQKITSGGRKLHQRSMLHACNIKEPHHGITPGVAIKGFIKGSIKVKTPWATLWAALWANTKGQNLKSNIKGREKTMIVHTHSWIWIYAGSFCLRRVPQKL